MTTRRITCCVLALTGLLSFGAVGRAADAPVLGRSFHGVHLGAPLETVREAIEGHCRKLSTIGPEPASLPTARTAESHLACLGFRVGGGGEIAEVAFTFTDGTLALIESRGGALERLLPHAGERSGSIAGFDLYLSTWTLALPDEDAVWSLTEEAARANVFLQRNQSLPSNSGTRSSAAAGVAIPADLRFGASLEDMTERLKAACDSLQTREIDRVWLPSKPRRQTQIDCFGYPFARFPRKVEAVFGDGKLELVWILTGKAEEDRLRKALIDEYGSAEQVSEQYEVFHGGRIALRKDRPEVLLLSDALIPLYQSTFAGSE